MFCKNCGKEFDDSEAFCPECGTPVVVENEQEAPAAEAAKKPLDVKTIGIIAAAVVVVILIVALIGGGNSNKKVIKKYMKALQKGDVVEMTSLQYPEKYLKAMYDEEFDLSLKEANKAYKEYGDAIMKALKDEGKISVKYEIKEIENVKKLDKLEDDADDRFGIEDLDDVQDRFEDSFDEYDLDSSKIKKAYVAKVKTTITCKKDKIYNNSNIVLLYQYGGKTYVAGLPSIYSMVNGIDDKDVDEAYEDAEEDLWDALGID